MTEHEAFLTAIRESPDDDTPRLMYADWLTEQGDLRGEFIRIQCELARMDAEDPRGPALSRRANSLLRSHNRGWRRSLPHVRGVRWGKFERGFVASAQFSSIRSLLPVLTEVLDAAPTAEIKLATVHRGDLKTLYTHRDAGRIRGLVLEPNWRHSIDVTELAEAPSARGLRSLKISRLVLGPAGATALTASPYLAGLQRLALVHGRLTDADVRALVDAAPFPSLKRLELRGNQIGPAGVRSLAAANRFRLTELSLEDNPIQQSGVEALAEAEGLTELTHLTLGGYRHSVGNCDVLLASRRLPRLRWLDLWFPDAREWRAEVLASAPQETALRKLTVHVSHLTARAVGALAQCPRLADLDELQLRGALHDPGAKALARSPYLASLRMLNLRFNEVGNRGAAALAAGPWRRLEALDLSWNQLGDAGVKALVNSPLGKHTSILNLAGNKYGAAGRALLKRRRVRAWPTSRGELPISTELCS